MSDAAQGPAADERRGELELRLAMLEALVQQAPAGIVAVEAPSGRVLFGNDKLAQLFARAPRSLEELADDAERHFHYPDGRRYARSQLPLVRALAEGTTAAGEEIHCRRDDGTTRVIRCHAGPLRDRSGAILGALAIFHDATEGRRFAEERDALLAKEQAARSEAEHASRAKDEFLATASHELRTPLNAILGWARLLRSGKLDQSGYFRALEIIERNAKAQVQLIEDLLDGSRIVTGKLRLDVRPLDLHALVRAALDAVRPAAEAKLITLHTQLDLDASRILGDAERLQQVVWNLANNAIKFTPKGGSVELRLRRVGTHLQLTVRDTGQGITPEFLPYVFDRFRQAEGSTTRRHGGLGLGLALVRHLVEAHGGTVSAESEGVGLGATFRVNLPVQAVLTGALEKPRADAPSGPAQRGALSGVRVLVVDDEPDARGLIATVLHAGGAEVTCVASAAQALEQLQADPPQVLVSDVGMPDTDGYRLMKAVRALPLLAHARLPAVALTAYAREEDRRRAMEAGFDRHVAKPVEPEELVRVVAELARGERPAPL